MSQLDSASGVGRVRKIHANFYYVESDGILYECFLRGMLKKEKDPVLAGDQVVLDSVDDTNQTARVSEILPRDNMLTRPKIANVSGLVIVQSMRQPAFESDQLNRFLAHAQLAGFTPVICLSKSDLAEDPNAIQAIGDYYEKQLGFRVIGTSIHQPESLQALITALTEPVYVLVGQSGTGKSTLLNALNPELKLRVGETSSKIERGQHTTRHVELLEVLPGKYIADTPGFSQVAFDQVMPEVIEGVFPEFTELRQQCAYDNCMHVDEPDCAVLAHREQIPFSRYESYRAMLAEAQTYKAFVQVSGTKDEESHKTLHGKGKRAMRIAKVTSRDREASRRTMRQRLHSLVDDAEEPV